MASFLDLLSILVVCISFQAVGAYPQTGELARLPAAGGIGVFSGLSEACKTAAFELLSSDFGDCADLLGLVSVLQTKQSIVAPINTWLASACSSSTCSVQALDSASQIIRNECRRDLEEQSIPATALYAISTHYNTTRNVICTQRKENLSFCAPSLLQAVDYQTGTNITVNEVLSYMVGNLNATTEVLLSVPKEVYCDDCGHALVTNAAIWIDELRNDPGIQFQFQSQPAVKQISQTCGPQFADGLVPGTISIGIPSPPSTPPQANQADS